MGNNLEDKVILVTGASKGIGYATSLKLAELGAKLVIASRNLNDLEKTGSEIEKIGPKPLIIPTDITKSNDVNNLFNAIIKKFGNTLGVKISKIGKICSQTQKPHIIDQKGGKIVLKDKGYTHKFQS